MRGVRAERPARAGTELPAEEGRAQSCGDLVLKTRRWHVCEPSCSPLRRLELDLEGRLGWLRPQPPLGMTGHRVSPGKGRLRPS